MSDLHYKPNRTKLFAGKCIDGPCEGEWHESDDASFMVYYVAPMGRVLDSNDIDSIGGYGNHYFYKWLHGYRAWAWMQPYSLKGGK